MAKISKIDANQPVKKISAAQTGKKIGIAAGMAGIGTILFNDVYVNQIGAKEAKALGKSKTIGIAAGIALFITSLPVICGTIGKLIGKFIDAPKEDKKRIAALGMAGVGAGAISGTMLRQYKLFKNNKNNFNNELKKAINKLKNTNTKFDHKKFISAFEKNTEKFGKLFKQNPNIQKNLKKTKVNSAFSLALASLITGSVLSSRINNKSHDLLQQTKNQKEHTYGASPA